MLAQQIIDAYRMLGVADKIRFFEMLAYEFAPDETEVRSAAEAYASRPGGENLAKLAKAVEPPRQEFFRRLNLAPNGTSEILGMRSDLIGLIPDHPEFKPVDADIVHLLGSWFNRGFLVLRRIDWSTPANILEKIIAYEAVHEIHGWDDLKRRLDPRDRRCFGFFHPSLVDEPLIFVEVALTDSIPGSIEALIDAKAPAPDDEPTTAVFYSISNCQKGLAGITFGSFLIKQVVTDLAHEIPSLKTFVTLSPVRGFRSWLERRTEALTESAILTPAESDMLHLTENEDWHRDEDTRAQLEPLLRSLAAHYLVDHKRGDGQPEDPVARFHLGNGARLEQINWPGDLSASGVGHAFGVMVNYLYDLADIERNHEAYKERGRVITSPGVNRLVKRRKAPVS